MKKIQLITLVGAVASTAALNAALVGGFDQRYTDAENTYNGTTWTDSAGSATATVSGAFTTTTTANGTTAVQNVTSGAANGNIMTFSRGSELGSAGQLTVQSVIRIDDSMDDRAGPYALDQTSGWGGLYAGANADGSNNYRGGNIGNTGTNTTIINGSGGSAVTAGTWGVLTVTVDSTVASPQLTASFTDLLSGSVLFSSVVDNGTIASGTLGFANNGVLFGGEVGQSPAEGWGGAIADVVVYNSLLTGAQLSGNFTEFQSLYQTAVPEPSTFALLSGLLALGAVMTRRRTK